MTEPTEDPKPDKPHININVSSWLGPTMFLWAVAAPCTMAVCRCTIAPDLTWWDVTMPLWGVPAVVASAVVSLIGVLLLAFAGIAVAAPPIYLYAWVRDGCRAAWGWSENWRYTRNEARIALDHVNIAEGIANRIKQQFASLGANDVSMRCQNVDLGVKACISIRLDGKNEIAGACSWSLVDAEGRPPKFFSNDLTSMILAVRKRRDEESSKAKSKSEEGK